MSLVILPKPVLANFEGVSDEMQKMDADQGTLITLLFLGCKATRTQTYMPVFTSNCKPQLSNLTEVNHCCLG